MVGEKDKLRSEIVTAISQMFIESKATSPPTPRTLEMLLSSDTMQFDQTNMTINIGDTKPLTLIILNIQPLLVFIVETSLK